MRILLLLAIATAPALIGGCAATTYLGHPGPYPDGDPTCEELVTDGGSSYAICRDIGGELLAGGWLDADDAYYLIDLVLPTLAGDGLPATVADDVVAILLGMLPEEVDPAVEAGLAGTLAALLIAYDTPAGGDLAPELQAGLQWATRGLADGLATGG